MSVNNKGVQSIYENGKSDGTKVNYDGDQDILGGEATNTTVNNGRQSIYSGSATDTIITNGGWQTIYKDGSSDRTKLEHDGQNVSGGVTTNTTLTNGSWQDLNCGTAIDTNVNSGSVQHVKGGISEKSMVDETSTQNVNAGGMANNSIIFGQQNINGGTANNSGIAATGTQTIDQGGKANTTTVEGGGKQVINSGGVAQNTTVEKGGEQLINAGGKAENNIISGQQNVIGTANNTTVNSDGTQEVRAGGKSTDNIISGHQYVSGEAQNNEIKTGAQQTIMGGGKIDTKTLHKGANQDVQKDALAKNNTIYGEQFVKGKAENNTIKDGGYQTVMEGGETNSNTIEKNGNQVIKENSIATKNTVNGIQTIESTGKAENNTINNEGSQRVQNGGTIKDTDINGGNSYLYAGSTSNGYLTVNNGGLLTAEADTSTTIDNITIDSNSNMEIENKTNSDANLDVKNVENNGGTISINQNNSNPFGYFTTLIVENFSGKDGNIKLNTDIANQEGDRLEIENLDVDANQILAINNNASSQATVDQTLTVVTTLNGGKESQFNLQNSVESGGYQFGLRQKNGKDWELYALTNEQEKPGGENSGNGSENGGNGSENGGNGSENGGNGTENGGNGTENGGNGNGNNGGTPILTSTADAAANSMISTYLANFVDTQTLLKRLGELRDTEQEHGVWGRIYSGKVNSFGNQLLAGFKMNYYAIQLGMDKKIHSDDADVYLGAAVSYLDADQDLDKKANYLATTKNQRNGSGSLKSYSLSLYATYLNQNNFYFDFLLKYSRVHNRFNVLDSAGASSSGKSNSNLFSFSGEMGKRHFFNADKNIYGTPQIQLTYTQFINKTFRASNGLTIDIPNRYSLLGRAGYELGYAFNGANPSHIYLKLSYLKEFSDDGDFLLNGSRENYSMKGHWWQYEIGTNMQINKQHNLYLDAHYSKGSKFDQKQINVGYRFNF